jgi:signal transduction histidine kinase
MNILWTKPSLSRDFALLSGLIVFILLMVSVWVTVETYAAHSDRIIKQMESEAARIDRAMIIEIDRASYLIDSLGRQIAEIGTDNLESIAKLLKSFDTNAAANNVFTFAETNQMVIVSSNKGVLTRTVDVSDRDYIKKSLAEPWKVHIGRPIQGRVSEKWVLPIGVGITDNSGKFLGTISISLDIASLSHELQTVIKKDGIHFAIFSKTLVMLTDNDGFITSSKTFMDKLKRLDYEDLPSGVLSLGSLLNPNQIYAYYETSANYPYIIILGYDSNLSGSTIFGLILPRLLQLLLMAIFMLSLLWMVRMRVIKPVIELTEITSAVARGEQFRSIKQSSPTEVESLAQEVSKLSDYLSERRRIAEENNNKKIQLKRSKEEAELSNHIKVEFLGAMSHELRTPLNTIVGFSEIMKNQMMGQLGNATYVEYAEGIYKSSHHLQELVDDVLTLSNAETGLADAQDKPVDVKLVVGKALRVVSEKLQTLQVSVEVSSQDMLPRLLVDEVRLKQIIANLILHAAKHSVAGGSILLSLSKVTDTNLDTWFVISFTDYGSKTSARMNINANDPRKQEPSGLSIPLTKALVTMLRAKLDVVSPPGKSTTVSVRFPKDRMVS